MRRITIFTCAMAMLLPLSLGVARPARANGQFQEIMKKKEVTVATEAAYYPFEFVDNGKIVGYDEDILQAIVKGWGVKLHQLDLPFAGILPGLLEKKFDFVATALLMNPDRAKRYAFTMPVAAVNVGLMRRVGDKKVNSVTDLHGLIIASATPPAGPTVIFMHYNDTLKPQGKAAAAQKMFSVTADEILALANGQADAMVESMPVLLGAMHRYPGKFEIVGTFGAPFWVGWVTRPGDLDLRDAINVQIRRLRDDGELAKLQKKWFGYTMDLPDSGYLPAGAIK